MSTTNSDQREEMFHEAAITVWGSISANEYKVKHIEFANLVTKSLQETITSLSAPPAVKEGWNNREDDQRPDLPNEWEFCLALTERREIDTALQEFADERSEDSSVILLQAILNTIIRPMVREAIDLTYGYTMEDKSVPEYKTVNKLEALAIGVLSAPTEQGGGEEENGTFLADCLAFQCKELKAEVSRLRAELAEANTEIIELRDIRMTLADRNAELFERCSKLTSSLPVAGVPDRIEKVESGFHGLFLKEAQAYKRGWNECRSAMLAAAPKSVASGAQGVPDVLFDGYAVVQELSEQAKARTSPENVSDTLDAAVRLIRRGA